MRRAAKVDSNQTLIVGALLSCGCKVLSLAAVGNGCPDLLVSHYSPKRDEWHLLMLEVKDGRKPPSARKLTPDQVAFHAAWAGSPVYVVESVEQALAIIAGVRT